MKIEIHLFTILGYLFPYQIGFHETWTLPFQEPLLVPSYFLHYIILYSFSSLIYDVFEIYRKLQRIM